MPYTITEPCVSTCDTACVDVCPVDCIHGPKSTMDSGEEAKASGSLEIRRVLSKIVYRV